MAAKQTSLSRGEKVFLLSVTIFVLVVVTIVLWQNSMNAMPTVSVPTPVMPNPNAFDYYVKAGNSLTSYNIPPAPGRTHSISFSSTKLINLITEGKHLSKNTRISRLPTSSPPYPVPDPTFAEIQQLLRINASAFATLRKGFQHEYREPPRRSYYQDTLHYGRFRTMANAFTTEAYVKRESGDWNGAANACLDSIRMGEDVLRGGPLRNMSAGAAIQSIGRTGLWPVIVHLDATQARASTRRMEEAMARQVPFVDVMQEEKWTEQASLLAMFRKPGWRKEMLLMLGGGNMPNGLATAQIFCISKSEIFRESTKHLDGMIANARLSYASSKSPPPLPKNPISQLLAPAFEYVQLKYVVAETQNALLTVSFALRAYKVEHGQYPASLNALTPGYLQAIPADSFALKGSLRYKRVGAGYVLYSIGPDGKDDGGTPSADGKARPRVPQGTPQPKWRRIVLDSKGDIVAGVNVN